MKYSYVFPIHIGSLIHQYRNLIRMSYLNEVKKHGQKANPFFCLMGIEPVSFGDGKARLSMVIRDDMKNGEGWLQGGMYTALGDEAIALAIYTLLSDKRPSQPSPAPRILSGEPGKAPSSQMALWSGKGER